MKNKISQKSIDEVVGLFDEIEAIKSEIVYITPFDSYDNNLVTKVIDERLRGLYELIRTNPEITQEYVEKAVGPINDSLDELHFKIDQLLPKDKKVTNF